MIIYSYKGSYKYQKHELLEKTWDEYSKGKPLPLIRRDDKGKPFFINENCHFSISHSHQYWVCVFSPYQVGVDIQFRKCSGNEVYIARRFFSREEAKMVETEGEEGFYKIWTRREALGKFLGTGFFIPKEILNYPVIQEFTLGDEYQGAIATEREEKIWIKTIS
jgi:phosphopantetheinyl transferase